MENPTWRLAELVYSKRTESLLRTICKVIAQSCPIPHREAAGSSSVEIHQEARDACAG
jgi:hypothetical protein